VASASKRIRLSEPGVAGSYQLVERRRDGSLVLRPEHERLSDVLRETEGQIFRDEEFAAHLQRVAETDEDLPSDQQSQPGPRSSSSRASTASSGGCRVSSSGHF